MDFVSDTFELLIPIIGIICTFVLVGILVWAGQRRREREAFYRHELAKHLADKGVEEEKLMEVLSADANSRRQARRGAILLVGLVTLFAGVGVMFSLYFAVGDVWVFGSIPALFGTALLIYGFVLAPK